MDKIIAASAAALLLGACATTGSEGAPAAPDYSPVPGRILSQTGEQVIACVRQAIDMSRYDMIGDDDGESRLVRFTCEGAQAQVLFEALAARSAEIGSEWREGSTTFRSTERIQQNLYGSDICQSDGATYRCVFNLNLGGFIR